MDTSAGEVATLDTRMDLLLNVARLLRGTAET